jgi:hypothetical protein
MLVPAHRQQRVPRHGLAVERDHAARTAPPRAHAQAQPVAREAMRRATVGRGLRAEHRDRERQHDIAQRRRQRPDQRADAGQPRAREQHQHGREEVAQTAQRDTARHRQRPAVDAVDPPVDREHAPVGADHEPLTHRAVSS